MSAYYNEHDPKAAAWLRELIQAGEIPAGDVDERSIVEVQPADLARYTQCHFFAGIGGWSYALRLAGWPTDRPVWTGSCPCQPFSSAGKSGGGAIRAIFGQRGVASSASAALQSSLVSRLKQRLDTAGSTLFAMTWKQKATPSGRSVCLLRASGHRTSGSGCGSWPTPLVSDTDEHRNHRDPRPIGYRALAETVRLSSWATPTTRDHKDTGDLSQSMTRRDSKERNDTVPRQAPGLISSGSPAETASPGQLNPAFSRWLQGYPVSWCQAAIRVSRTLTLQRKRGSCG